MTVGRTAIAGLAFLACTAIAGAQDDGDVPLPEIARPNYSFLRQNEDWSSFRDAEPAQLTDFWDSIKFVPLNEDGSIWASFGGSTRLRLESWSNFAFGAPKDDNDTFLLWRTLLHADIHFGEDVRTFVQVKSALSTDRDLPGGRRTADVDSFDLEQAFADVRIPLGDEARMTLRPGRQALLLGKQRLVSPLAWSNTLRRWDGVSAFLDGWGWRLHGFWAQFVPVEKYEFNDPDRQTQLFGLYATTTLGDSGVGLDAYWLGLDRDDQITFNGTTGEEERYTLGGRLFGKFGESGFDYDFEGAWQYGEVGAGDVDAFMIGSQLGYTAPALWGSPRFWVGFDYGSGDDKAGGDVETFNQLYPLGHAYLGYIDFVGRQNIIDLNLGASGTPFEKATLSIAGHLFWRDSDNDALYSAGGAVVRGGAAGGDSEVGQEIDVVLKYRFNRHLLGELGYSHFFAGDFIDESGPSDDIDFVYVQLEYTF